MISMMVLTLFLKLKRKEKMDWNCPLILNNIILNLMN